MPTAAATVTAAQAPTDGRGAAAPARRRLRGIPVVTAARWAVLVALGLSTQYLFQPFVWQNWPVGDVLFGWLDVLVERAVVALTIAAAVTVASCVRRRGWQAVAIATAIVAGAFAGQFVLLAVGAEDTRADLPSLVGSAVQWIGITMCAAGTYFLWRRRDEAAAAVRRDVLQRSEIEAAAVRTELEALRQQIDPHFLFNTLATIRHLRDVAPQDGHRLLRHLRDYLCSAEGTGAARSTLGDEVDLVSSYLAIVGTRMSGRLATRVDVPDALRACECPPLTLATLVENAVRHGITPSGDGGSIEVSARRDGAMLELAVVDTGVGFVQGAAATVGGTGIGLANTRARLRALHGAAASLKVEANVPRGVRATIRIPAGGTSP